MLRFAYQKADLADKFATSCLFKYLKINFCILTCYSMPCKVQNPYLKLDIDIKFQ